MKDLLPESRKILEARYLLRDSRGRVIETPEGMFARVARAVADGELAYGSAADAREWEERFFAAMSRLDFLPNSPTLMNAGTEIGQLSACFVIPVPDSIPGIFRAIADAAMVQKTGGGVGMTFEDLRPRGDPVGEIRGGASGPLSFMRIFNQTAQEIKQGGRRRGAMMAVMSCRHPDILDFIWAKREEGNFANYNLSVSVDGAFFDALERDGEVVLVSPRTGVQQGRLQAAELWREIGRAAHATGDPGLLFLDRIAADHPTPGVGPLRVTNPCGEIPLLPYEACTLASINLMSGSTFDEKRFRKLVRLGVRFLDNVITVSRYPLAEIAEAVDSTRKIGLGVMGFADLLIAMGIPYHSPDAIRLGDEIARVLREEADRASRDLGSRRGPFRAAPRSIYREDPSPPRNATRTAIAPTGTISLIAGVSSSIEPLFALAFERVGILEAGMRLGYLHPRVARLAEEGRWTDSEREEVIRTGSVAGLACVSEEMKRLLAISLEIPSDHHIAVQAAFQRHVDNAVSKTINLPEAAGVEDVLEAFLLARRLGCKGITVFREGARGLSFLKRGLGKTAEEGTPHPCACVPE